MIFHWDDENRAHIARHGVSSSQAEAAFGADDAQVFQDAARLNRWILGATVEGRTLNWSPSPGLSPRASGSSRPTG